MEHKVILDSDIIPRSLNYTLIWHQEKLKSLQCMGSITKLCYQRMELNLSRISLCWLHFGPSLHSLMNPEWKADFYKISLSVSCSLSLSLSLYPLVSHWPIQSESSDKSVLACMEWFYEGSRTGFNAGVQQLEKQIRSVPFLQLPSLGPHGMSAECVAISMVNCARLLELCDLVCHWLDSSVSPGGI